MAIEIQETFEIRAPIELVWRFLNTPEAVVGCLPGMSLSEVLDERNFLGKAKIKLGAMTMSYKGKMHFRELDETNHVLVMEVEGKDPSGGTVRGEITCSLSALEGGTTQMVTDARIDLTGKAMQVGGGMIKGVSHQLFLKFAKTTTKRLEAEAEAEGAVSSVQTGAGEAAASGAATPPVAEDDAPLKVIPLLFSTLAAAIGNFFRRLFGGGASS